MRLRYSLCFVLLSILIAPGCTEKPKPESPRESPPPAAESKGPPAKETDGEEVAVIQTKEGRIVLRFYEKDAPLTVTQFKRLAGRSFYNGTTFHRVIAGSPAKTENPGWTQERRFSMKRSDRRSS